MHRSIGRAVSETDAHNQDFSIRLWSSLSCLQARLARSPVATLKYARRITGMYEQSGGMISRLPLLTDPLRTVEGMSRRQSRLRHDIIAHIAAHVRVCNGADFIGSRRKLLEGRPSSCIPVAPRTVAEGEPELSYRLPNAGPTDLAALRAVPSRTQGRSHSTAACDIDASTL